MSYKSWIAEFYPIAAEDMLDQHPIAQTMHALRKWTGASPENLAKHNMVHHPTCGAIFENSDEVLIIDSLFYFGADECVWCQEFMIDVIVRNHKCRDCPLYDLRNRVRCFNIPRSFDWRGANWNSPYGMFSRENKPTPVPMIICIQQILKKQLAEEMEKRREHILKVQHTSQSIGFSTPDCYDTLIYVTTYSDKRYALDESNLWSTTIRDLMLAGF